MSPSNAGRIAAAKRASADDSGVTAAVVVGVRDSGLGGCVAVATLPLDGSRAVAVCCEVICWFTGPGSSAEDVPCGARGAALSERHATSRAIRTSRPAARPPTPLIAIYANLTTPRKISMTPFRVMLCGVYHVITRVTWWPIHGLLACGSPVLTTLSVVRFSLFERKTNIKEKIQQRCEHHIWASRKT